VSTTCPACNTPNTVTLPQGAKFFCYTAKLAYRPLSDFRASGSFRRIHIYE